MSKLVALKKPKVSWETEKSSFYTLMMIDPDAPNRETHKARNWKHWVVVNIPGNDVDKGEEETPYARPTPPLGSGLHRYVFLVYKQSQKIKTPTDAKYYANNNR